MTTVSASSTADVHRNAYNAAFHELGLNWVLELAPAAHQLSDEGERECVRKYLLEHQAHLLTAYDPEFLLDAIQTAKSRCYARLTAAGSNPAAHINWHEIQQRQPGV
jgi:hypothetical protein